MDEYFALTARFVTPEAPIQLGSGALRHPSSFRRLASAPPGSLSSFRAKFDFALWMQQRSNEHPTRRASPKSYREDSAANRGKRVWATQGKKHDLEKRVFEATISANHGSGFLSAQADAFAGAKAEVTAGLLCSQ